MPNGNGQQQRGSILPAIAGVGLGLLGLLFFTRREDVPVEIPERRCTDPDVFNPTAVITYDEEDVIVQGTQKTFSAENSFDIEDSVIEGNNIQWSVLNFDRIELIRRNGFNFSYTFNNTGTYFVQLLVRDSDGCTDTTEVTISVEERANVETLFKNYAATGRVAFINPAEPSKIELMEELIANSIRYGGYYRGNNKYVVNVAGEMLPARGAIEPNPLFNARKDLESLATFIKNGGVWIDYTGYAMFYEDTPICVPWTSVCDGSPTRWNIFCDFLNIPELAGDIQPSLVVENSTFYVQNRIPEFPYNRSLALIDELPPPQEFKTSNMVNELRDSVPYVYARAYSMFALTIGNGIYFYSNSQNSAEDYATFITKVHNKEI